MACLSSARGSQPRSVAFSGIRSACDQARVAALMFRPATQTPQQAGRNSPSLWRKDASKRWDENREKQVNNPQNVKRKNKESRKDKVVAIVRLKMEVMKISTREDQNPGHSTNFKKRVWALAGVTRLERCPLYQKVEGSISRAYGKVVGLSLVQVVCTRGNRSMFLTSKFLSSPSLSLKKREERKGLWN